MAATNPAVLENLKIVTMAEQYPGPYATMLLADMGAEVIMVERSTGDPVRMWPPFYQALNRCKKSVVLDIKKPDDLQELLALLSRADIFFEGFRPGKMDKAGLGYAALSALNPRLIYASISGYGQTGPYRDRPGHDITYQGVGGALSERLEAADAGTPSSLLLGDLGAALFATIGVLSALEARHRTGRGTYIDVAMSDTVAALMAVPIGLTLNGGANLAGPAAEPAYDVFRTADGRWLTLSIAHEDDYWARLCELLGLSHLRGLPRPERVNRRAALNEEVRAVIRKQPYSRWESLLTEAGQMFGPAHALQEVPSDPHLAARGLFESFIYPDGRTQVALRQPVKFLDFENVRLSPSPALGEHTGEVLRRKDEANA